MPKSLTWAKQRKKNNKVGIFQRYLFKTKTARNADTLQKFDNYSYNNPRKLKYFPKEIKALQMATNVNYMKNGSFYEAIGPVLAMAQCFAVMPVMGIKSKNGAESLYYTWKSVRCIYSIVVFLLSNLITVITIYWAFSEEIQFNNLVTIIFFSSISYARVCFGVLAMKWPKLMYQWQIVEKQLPELKTQLEKSKLSYKIKMLAIVVLTISLVEHMLSTLTVIHNINYCNRNRKDADSIRDVLYAEMSQIFYVTSYTPLKAFLGKFLNVLSTFLWTYMDLFVMLISVGLASRFKLLNDHMMKFKGHSMPEQFWMENRIIYRQLCQLCESMDNAISKITMISFANNLFFVCVQLLKSLNTMESISHAVYFWFSIIFLITRTLAVSLYAADINDESKKPIQIFRAVPKESWCAEIRRFSDEVTNDVVALSGMKFFHLTRRLVLSVAGTIVTYELVLIQFHKDGESDKLGCE